MNKASFRVEDMPIISSVLMFVGILVLFILSIALPVELLGAFFPRVRVRVTNEHQLKKFLDLIDLVQREDPAKLEKARALQKPSAPVTRSLACEEEGSSSPP